MLHFWEHRGDLLVRGHEILAQGPVHSEHSGTRRFPYFPFTCPGRELSDICLPDIIYCHHCTNIKNSHNRRELTLEGCLGLFALENSYTHMHIQTQVSK